MASDVKSRPEVELDAILADLISVADCARDLAIMQMHRVETDGREAYQFPVHVGDQICAMLRFGVEAARMHLEGRP